MTIYPFKDIFKSTDRYKIFTLLCSPDELLVKIEFVKSQGIKVLNIGKELANFIDSLNDYEYLNIDVFDHLKKILEQNKSEINSGMNSAIAIHNLGILLEPALQLNAVKLFKEFSKSCALIIIWENQSEIPGRLNWSTQKQNIFIDFSDIPLKILQNEI